MLFLTEGWILLVSAQLNVPFKRYNKKYFGSNFMGGKVLWGAQNDIEVYTFVWAEQDTASCSITHS